MSPALAADVRARLRAVRLAILRGLRAPGRHLDAVMLAVAVLIGALGALGVLLFFRLIDVAYDLLVVWPLAHLPATGGAFYRPLLTGGGFVLAWALVRRLSGGHDGLNVPDVQRAVADGGGDLPAVPAAARTAASAVTIGTGGSAGAEGPVAVLGAAVGSAVARGLALRPTRMRVLVGAGTAAGIAAAFNAPLAGAFFALEEILGSLATNAFAPVVVSSVTASLLSRAWFGNHPAFSVPFQYSYTFYREIFLFFPLLGVVTGLVSALFVRTEDAVAALPRATRLPPWAIPLLGGVAVGLMALVSGGALTGRGHIEIHLQMFRTLPWFLLLALALGKILATVLTLGTGGSGGVFTPSLYVGAVTGSACGQVVHLLFPRLPIQPEAYGLVGMGAVVAAATGAPITGILLVFEITNDYAIVLPLMLATAVAVLVARAVARDTLYSAWLRRRGERADGPG